MVRFGGFPVRLLGPLLKTSLPLIGNVHKPLAKSIMVSLWLATAASATDAAIQKNIFGFGRPLDVVPQETALVLSNKKLDVIKIVKSLECVVSLIKVVSETVENEVKEQKGGFLSASLLSSVLTGKGVIKAGEGTNRAGQNS